MPNNTKFTPSKYQQAIFDYVKNSKNNIEIEALAGSGKTTTLVNIPLYFEQDSNWLAIAFNVKNEKDLKEKSLSSGKIYNFNKLGYSICHKNIKNLKFDANKTYKILDKVDRSLSKNIKFDIARGVSLAKSYYSFDEKFLKKVFKYHDLNSEEKITNELFASVVLKVLEISKKETSIVDFQDQIWLPLILNFDFPIYDNILVDEAQDLDQSQIEFLFKLQEASNGRVIYCGDRNQAMYQFRGASAESMNKLKERFNADSFSLPVSYRCSKEVIKKAQTIVPSIEAADNAVDGSVQTIQAKDIINFAKPGCFILSRLNAPLLSITLEFIKNKIPCNIQGRDVGSGIVSLIKKWKAKNVSDLQEKVKIWSKHESQQLIYENKSPLPVLDKAECILVLSKHYSSIAEIISTVEELFGVNKTEDQSQDEKRIICSTVHKAKGLERKDVFVLMNTFLLDGPEEKNIKYVAFTRAKENLYLVFSPKKEKKKFFKRKEKVEEVIIDDNQFIDDPNESSDSSDLDLIMEFFDESY